MGFEEKTDFLDIWGCGFCWVALEPPLPERRTQSDGAPDGRGGTRVDLETGSLREALLARRGRSGDKAGGAR